MLRPIRAVSFFLLIALAIFGLLSLFRSQTGFNTNNLAVPMLNGDKQTAVGGMAPTVSRQMAQDSSTIPPLEQTAPTDTKDRIVVKNGSLSLVVPAIDPAIDRIKQISQSQGGYITNTSQSSSDFPAQPIPLSRPAQEDANTVRRPTTATISLRIPAEKLDSTMTELRKVGEITQESITADDVTDQFVDLQARLKNLQVTESQLQSFMAKATNVSETLQVYGQLSQTRGQIEQLQGQINYLSQTAKLSQITVTLTLEEKAIAQITIGKWHPLVALQEAFYSLLNFLKSISYFAIWLVVFGLIWIPALLLTRYLYRRFRKETP